MAATAAVTDQFKQDILNGVHQPGDTYKIALYTQAGASSFGKSTTAYTASGEIGGAGYTAAGAVLSGFTVGLSGDTATLTFTNPTWAASSFTADMALIYNHSRSDKALCVLLFTTQTSSGGTFTLRFTTVPISSA